MRTARSLACLAVAALTALTIGGSAGGASAADQAGTVRTATYTTGAGAASAQLTVTFDQPRTPAQAAEIGRSLGFSSAGTAHPDAAPTGQKLRCNHLYQFTDNNGTFSIQHGCTATSSPWGFAISPFWCAHSIAPVAEHGMSWARNGHGEPRQAPHVEPCGYHFHGTFNPDHDNDHISYADVFDLKFDFGTGQLQIYGNFTTTGSRTV